MKINKDQDKITAKFFPNIPKTIRHKYWLSNSIYDKLINSLKKINIYNRRENEDEPERDWMEKMKIGAE